MLVKRKLSENVYGRGPQDPRDMAKATLPELQFPAMLGTSFATTFSEAMDRRRVMWLPSELLVHGRRPRRPLKGTNGAPKSRCEC
jgi:hypothetical protein